MCPFWKQAIFVCQWFPKPYTFKIKTIPRTDYEIEFHVNCLFIHLIYFIYAWKSWQLFRYKVLNVKLKLCGNSNIDRVIFTDVYKGESYPKSIHFLFLRFALWLLKNTRSRLYVIFTVNFIGSYSEKLHSGLGFKNTLLFTISSVKWK